MKTTTCLNSLRTLSRAAAMSVGLSLASISLQAEVVFRFGFDEGTGSTVTNAAGTLTGILGPPVVPNSNPTTSDASPSGGATDKSVVIAAPAAYLLMDSTNNPALHDVTQPITAEAWIKIPEGTTFSFQGITGYGRSWKMGLLDNGDLAFTLFGVVDIDSQVFVPQGSWVHVAAAWEPGVGVRFYLNGVASSFIEETRAMTTPINSYLAVGAAGFSGEPLTASMDRVRVHRAVLTVDQLDSDAATPKAPLGSTVAAFDFTEATPPYSNTGSLPIPARPAQPIQIALSSPKFVTGSPSAKSGDTALFFDGNDTLAVDDPSQIFNLPTGNFTVQAWVKFDILPATRQVLLGNFGPGGALSFSVAGGGAVQMTTYGIRDVPSAAKVPDDGLWHHLAIVHSNGTDLKFYVDGVLGDTIAYTSGLGTRATTTFHIGSEFGTGLLLNGSIDRVQMDDVPLAQEDLDYLAIPGVTPDAPTLAIGTAVSIAWPTVATGFILQSNTNVSNSATWSNVNTTPLVVGDKYYTLLPTTETETFYRLVRPE
jgi:hypothetical protein